jgi:hypothetical protein
VSLLLVMRRLPRRNSTTRSATTLTKTTLRKLECGGGGPAVSVRSLGRNNVHHFYQRVPGWAAFTALYTQAVANAPKSGARFVEVGSWLGRSAAYMGVEIENSGKDIEFICIDPWIDGGPDLRDTIYAKQLGGQSPFELFTHNTATIAHRIKPLRMTSVQGATRFSDKSVDFIMLDGDHSYEAVKADIAAWRSKMKDGGTMSGDDFTWPGVRQAVTETFGSSARVWINGQENGNPKADYRKDASYWSVTL